MIFGRLSTPGLVAIGGLVLGSGLLVTSGAPEGPGPVMFAVHRLDMAMVGVILAVLVAAMPERPRRRRTPLSGQLIRALWIRLGLMAAGAAAVRLMDAISSGAYWDHSPLSLAFHLLGPARMFEGQSLAVAGFGLTCTSEVIHHLVTGFYGTLAGVTLLLALDVCVFTLLGMAGERGLPPFRVFQGVSRVAWTVALASVPVAFYKGAPGYWGLEPFAWLFWALLMGMLATAASRR